VFEGFYLTDRELHRAARGLDLSSEKCSDRVPTRHPLIGVAPDQAYLRAARHMLGDHAGITRGGCGEPRLHQDLNVS
jgi:hypothetical protein